MGEASHPGPSFTVASLNVTTLLKHIAFVKSNTVADVQALQEVRLTADAIPIADDELDGVWDTNWGRPQPIRRGTVQSRMDAKQGGVGLISQKSTLRFLRPGPKLVRNFIRPDAGCLPRSD